MECYKFSDCGIPYQICLEYKEGKWWAFEKESGWGGDTISNLFDTMHNALNIYGFDISIDYRLLALPDHYNPRHWLLIAENKLIGLIDNKDVHILIRALARLYNGEIPELPLQESDVLRTVTIEILDIPKPFRFAFTLAYGYTFIDRKEYLISDVPEFFFQGFDDLLKEKGIPECNPTHIRISYKNKSMELKLIEASPQSEEYFTPQGKRLIVRIFSHGKLVQEKEYCFDWETLEWPVSIFDLIFSL